MAEFEKNEFNYRKGVIGCALSHYNLWKMLLNDFNNNYYCIFEDDIIFIDNFKEKLERKEATTIDKSEALEFFQEYQKQKPTN